MSYYREIEFKQWQSTIQPRSSKRTIAYYLKLLNIKKSMTYDIGNSKNILLCNFRYMYAKLMLLYICISVHKHSRQKLHIKINILSFLQGSLKCKKKPIIIIFALLWRYHLYTELDTICTLIPILEMVYITTIRTVQWF